MNTRLMTGNEAAGWGMRLAEVDYLPAFPITPQTEIIERMAAWIADGACGCRMVEMDSEHSMLTAAAAAAATGVRVCTATSSQGLLHAMEMLYTVPGWRAPFVLINVSRGLASPITLEADHNDALAAAGSGFLQIHCATCQEVLDAMLLAFRLGEDPRVRLPVMVNMDGFLLSFTREPVHLPTVEAVRGFLPPHTPGPLRFRAGAPVAQAASVLGGGPYSYFRYQAHLAAAQALEVYREAAVDFRDLFGRAMEAVDSYRMEDAEYAFVLMGSHATKAMAAVDALRLHGWAIGVVRPRLLVPFPAPDLWQALRGLRAVAVLDQNLAPGLGGALYTWLAALQAQQGWQTGDRPGNGDSAAEAPPMLLGYVGGLGGRDITLAEFHRMAEEMRQAVRKGQAPPPRLLYTQEELDAVQGQLAVALGDDARPA